MWHITPTGFFSIVEKPADKRSNTLTVRARVRSDLVALKRDVLPSMGAIRQSSDTDYRFRATAPRTDVASAIARMVESLDYSNFKNAVAQRQGAARAHLYHDVWSVLYRMQGDPAYDARERAKPPPRLRAPEADAYGGVLINAEGQTLLCEPAGHFGGYVWTFPKGRPEPGETPATTALREVLEETGQPARIVTVIPQVFAGTTSSTAYFLMRPDGEPGRHTEETGRVYWADAEDARRLISETTTAAGRKRDLAVLDAAYRLWSSGSR